jgi:hypothetical protein
MSISDDLDVLSAHRDAANPDTGARRDARKRMLRLRLPPARSPTSAGQFSLLLAVEIGWLAKPQLRSNEGWWVTQSVSNLPLPATSLGAGKSAAKNQKWRLFRCLEHQIGPLAGC